MAATVDMSGVNNAYLKPVMLVPSSLILSRAGDSCVGPRGAAVASSGRKARTRSLACQGGSYS